jgi:hypothetical protein
MHITEDFSTWVVRYEQSSNYRPWRLTDSAAMRSFLARKARRDLHSVPSDRTVYHDATRPDAFFSFFPLPGGGSSIASTGVLAENNSC